MLGMVRGEDPETLAWKYTFNPPITATLPHPSGQLKARLLVPTACLF